MARINDNYLKLKASYLFSDIARRIKDFQAANPGAKLIRLGIGDVTQPLPPAVVTALHAAVDEMTKSETFRGYGPEQGYEFLQELIVTHDYATRGVKLAADEIFVSDGGKCDSGNIQEIFAPDAVVALTDPVYPVYVDSNVMAGRSGAVDASGRYAGFVYLPCTAENGFQPALPDRHVDLIYLCYPNNPTGAVLHTDALKPWVDYARREQAVILYDAAYESYIREAGVPHSIYEIEGAQRGRDRVSQLLEDGRLHRHALRLHGRAEGATGPRPCRRGRQPQRALVPAAVDEVQLRPVRGPARRRRRLHARRARADHGADRLLHGERAHHS